MPNTPLSLGDRRADTLSNVSKLSSPRGNLIAYWRSRRQGKPGAALTQKELAQLIGKSTVMVGRYERGLRNPSLDVLFSIGAALETPPHILYPGLWRTRFAEMREKRNELGLGPALP